MKPTLHVPNADQLCVGNVFNRLLRLSATILSIASVYNDFLYTGKTYTMIGVDKSASTLGVIPCAIHWLFKLINDRKEQTGARFSVRVSAVEITGKSETLKDLLADVASGEMDELLLYPDARLWLELG